MTIRILNTEITIIARHCVRRRKRSRLYALASLASALLGWVAL